MADTSMTPAVEALRVAHAAIWHKDDLTGWPGWECFEDVDRDGRHQAWLMWGDGDCFAEIHDQCMHAHGEPGAIARYHGEPGAIARYHGEPGAIARYHGEPGAIARYLGACSPEVVGALIAERDALAATAGRPAGRAEPGSQAGGDAVTPDDDGANLSTLSAISGIEDAATPLHATIVLSYLDDEGEPCMATTTIGDSTLTDRLGALVWAQHTVMEDPR